MDVLFNVALGIGLSAACGFRIFVPLLVMSVASLTGNLTLSPGFQWIGTWPALVVFSAATVTEVAAYYFPWIDHALDVVATPAAIVAGIVVSASLVTGISPMLKWTLAVIAGGGAAGLIQGTTVLARAASSASTGGLGNPIVATLEFLASLITSIISVMLPIAALILLAIIAGWLVAFLMRRRKRSAQTIGAPAVAGS